MSHKAIALIVLAASLMSSAAAFADTTEDDVTWINQCIADNKKEGATEGRGAQVLRLHEQRHGQ